MGCLSAVRESRMEFVEGICMVRTGLVWGFKGMDRSEAVQTLLPMGLRKYEPSDSVSRKYMKMLTRTVSLDSYVPSTCLIA